MMLILQACSSPQEYTLELQTITYLYYSARVSQQLRTTSTLIATRRTYRAMTDIQRHVDMSYALPCNAACLMLSLQRPAKVWMLQTTHMSANNDPELAMSATATGPEGYSVRVCWLVTCAVRSAACKKHFLPSNTMLTSMQTCLTQVHMETIVIPFHVTYHRCKPRGPKTLSLNANLSLTCLLPMLTASWLNLIHRAMRDVRAQEHYAVRSLPSICMT